MIKILIGTLLALTAVNSIAGNLYIHKGVEGQVLLTNVNPTGNLDKFAKKVRTTYYKDTSKDSIKPISKKYSESEKNNRSKDTYIKVNDNIPIAKKVIRQSKPTTDNIAKFYEPLNWSQTDKQHFEYLKSTETVQVIEDNDLNRVYNSMLANGYSLLGRSQFKDRALPNSMFISQAKKLGASHVIIYKENTSTIEYDINDDLNNLDYAYQYVSDFYVKNNYFNKPDMLGLNYREIPLEKRSQLQRNTGAYVSNIIKDSRVYFANILLGDVVTAINGKEIRIIEDFDRIKKSELKRTRDLNLTIIRLVNNEPKEIQITVNFN